jgi:mannose-1-phosphate guanylyltransferase
MSAPQRVAVIMAGGSGERFWPVSRRLNPKQLLRLTSPTDTMLHEAVNRLLPLIPASDIFVQTSPELVAAIREAKLAIPDENVIAEPCRRNTAGCLAYAAAYMMARYKNDGSGLSMAVVTADHRIGAAEAFIATLRTALETVESEPALGTIGIPPTRPATGFGYVQAELPEGASDLETTPQAFPVASFQEKPPLDVAERYVAEGNYFWNSGMFFWNVGTFVNQFEKADPAYGNAIHAMAKAMAKNDESTVNAVFSHLKGISIDYALMEKAERVVMINATFPWDDIGTWSALDRAGNDDADGNVCNGDPVLIDSTGCIVYNDEGAKKRALAVVGMSDVVVVATKDAVLVVPKDRTEDVKKAVQELGARGATQL